MSDMIEHLKPSKDPSTKEELNIMREIFQSGGNVKGTSKLNYNMLIYCGVIFLVMNLPAFDSLIKGFIQTTDLILLVMKAAIFMLIIFVLQLMGF